MIDKTTSLVGGARERMLFLAEFETSPHTYAMPIVLRIGDGHVDAAVFASAFRDVAERHRSLRTSFTRTPDGWAEDLRDAAEVRVDDRSAQAWDGTLPFAIDPTRDVPAAAAVHSGHIVIVIHHVAADGQSVPVILDDLEHAYASRSAGHPPAWPDVPAEYSDPPADPADGFAEAFADIPATTDLPTDRPRRGSPGSDAGMVARPLPASVARAITDTTVRHRLSRLMLLQAAVGLALRAHGAGDRIAVGSAADLRDDTDSTVGLYLNTIAIPTDMSGGPTVGDFLARVRTSALDSLDRRNVPFDALVAAIDPPRYPGVHPVFQVMIADVDRRPRRVALGGVSTEVHHDAEPTAKFDLTFAIGADDDALVVDLVYRSELFDPTTATDVLESVVLALVALTGSPATPADEITLTRSAGDRRASSRHSPATTSRRVDAPKDHVAAALTAAYVSNDALGTRRDGDRYVPSSLDEILDAATVTAEFRAPDTRVGRPLAAAVVDGGVVLTATSEVIDDESWPAVLALLSGSALVAGRGAAEHAEEIASRGDDLAIVDAAEAWLDVLDEIAETDHHRSGPIAASDTVAHADLSSPPSTVLELRSVVVAALAAETTGPVLMMVSEPDRDDPAHAAVIDARRRGFPVLVRADGTVEQPDAQSARDYMIAGAVSPHTPGVFDDAPDPDILVDVHVSDRPVTHRPGRVAVTVSPVGDRWRITVSGHRHAGVVADRIARHPFRSEAPSVIDSIVRPARSQADDVAGIGVAAIRRIEREAGPLQAVYPTTSLQEGLLFHRDLSGDTDVYVSQTITELAGALDPAGLRAAAARVIDHHPHVAGHFRRIGERSVLVVPRRPTIEWDVRRGDDPEEFITEQRRLGFGENGPQIRFGLLTRTDRAHHTWVFTAEHAMLDGWSIWRLLRSVLDEYTRAGAAAETVGAPYSAYMSWLVGRDAATATKAWGDVLADVESPTLVAPRDSGTPSADAGRSLERVVTLDASLTDRLKAVGARARTPLSTVYELAWGLALRHETGADDIVFGTVTSGRPAEIPGIDELLGLLFNTVPVRVRISPRDNVARHLDELARYRRVMLAHPYVPLAEILAESGHRELFDTLFVFQNIPVTAADERLGPDGALNQREQTVRDATHYPLTVVVNPGDAHTGARIRVMWRPAAWGGPDIGQDAVDRIVAAFHRALSGIAAHPGPVASLDLRTPDDASAGHLTGALVAEEDADLLGSTVWELLERRARIDPHAVAVVAGETRWTFDELRLRASGLASALQDRGIGPESRVALYLPRDERMIAALFAVFAAHAAYVPIDPGLPAQRVAEIVAAAEPDVVVSDESLAAALSGGYQVIPPESVGSRPLVDPVRRLESLAYVIFTSGSTGRPKGVAVPYRGLTNMFVNHRTEIFGPVVAAGGGRRMAIAHTTSFAFDASWEQLLWLLEGHSVHVIDDDMRRDPRALLDYYDEHRIDGFDVTPSYGQVLVDEGLLTRERCTDPTADAPGVTFVSLGGEAVPDALWSALRDAPGVGGYNLYGPTEYTINALGADVAERSTSTVGRPITGTVAHVLDRGLLPVRPGVVGELYLSGVGLARGYLGRSDLTCERFVADPFGPPGARMYRTGDLVSVGSDGLLTYLGRDDHQVKIRGHRVEPAEVASAVAALDPVLRAAVVPIRGDRGTELAAYVVPVAGMDPDATAIRRALRDRVPDYLVPSTVTFVDDLPLNVNGKLDMRALPAPERESVETQKPIGDVEFLIAQTVADVLGVDAVGRDDDFFMLGGHSLLAVRVTSRLRSSAGLDLNVRDLYATPTVAGLARAAAGDRDEAMFAPVVQLREADGPAVFCLQPAGGLGWAYAGLCRHLDPSLAVYALQDPALSGGPELDSVDALVADQIDRIRRIRPTGPYHLLGWSFGGQLAHAIAARLGDDDVASVVLLDSYADGVDDEPAVPVDDLVAEFVAGIGTDPVLADLDPEARSRLVATFERHLRLSIPPSIGSIGGDVLLVAATVGVDDEVAARRDADWRSRIDGELRVEQVALDHGGLGRAANWEVFGPAVAEWIESAR